MTDDYRQLAHDALADLQDERDALREERDRYKAMWDALREQYVDPAEAAHGDSWLEMYMASIEARHRGATDQ